MAVRPKPRAQGNLISNLSPPRRCSSGQGNSVLSTGTETATFQGQPKRQSVGHWLGRSRSSFKPALRQQIHLLPSSWVNSRHKLRWPICARPVGVDLAKGTMDLGGNRPSHRAFRQTTRSGSSQLHVLRSNGALAAGGTSGGRPAAFQQYVSSSEPGRCLRTTRMCSRCWEFTLVHCRHRNVARGGNIQTASFRFTP